MDSLSCKFRINIPKIIWQTGRDSYENLQYPLTNCANTWMQLNPDWEYRYADQKKKYSDIVEFGDQDFIELSEHLFGKYIADLWRYIMLYQHGGVYSDLDSICWLSLDMVEYNLVSLDTQVIVSNESGYNNLGNHAVYAKDNKTEYCSPCYEFSRIIKSGPQGKPTWMNNGAFAAIKESEVLKNVLDEVKYRFRLFKDLHKDGFDISHEMLRFTVDCSAFEVGVTKNENLISRTFINSIQSYVYNNSDKQMFRDIFADVQCYSYNKINFS